MQWGGVIGVAIWKLTKPVSIASGLGPLGRSHLAFAMLQLENARSCGGARGSALHQQSVREP